MPISSVNRAKTITVPLDASSGDQFVTVYQSSELTIGSELIPGYKVVSYNVFIKNLKAFSKIASLPEVALPDFEIDDSDTTKVYKTLDVEWKSARKQLNLFIGIENNWNQIGSTSILNPSGYPFRIYSLLDMFTDNLYFELGENGKIAVAMEDVGYGTLAGADSIVIHGSYVEEIFVEYAEPSTYITVPVTIPPITVNVTGGSISNQSSNQEEDDDMANWIIKNSDYTAVAKDKIIADVSSQGGMVITLPANPPIGTPIAVMIIGDYVGGLSFNFNGNSFRGGSGEQFRPQLTNVSGTFVYVSNETGWVTDLPLYDSANQSS